MEKAKIILKQGKLIKAIDEKANAEKFWFELHELQETLNLSDEEIKNIIKLGNRFVENKNREITTRKQYRSKTPFFEKLMHSFKNKID